MARTGCGRAITLFLALSLWGCATTRTDEAELRALTAQIGVAIRQHDTATLGAILDEDFVVRGPGSPSGDRRAFLAAVGSTALTILSLDITEVAVAVHGGVGLVTGVQRGRVRLADRREVDDAGAFSDLFVRRRGRWRVVLSYTVPMAR